MHLYLIRHAQSANNALYALNGTEDGRVADPPLTEIGHRQAQLLARFLVAPSQVSSDGQSLAGWHAARHDRWGFDLTHLYCSLMLRAVQTGGYVAEATGLPLVAWPEVHERGGLHQIDTATGEDRGVPGPNRAWFAAEYPGLALPGDLGERGWWDRPMELVDEAIPRARRVWAQLLERHGSTDDHVAVVTHGGFFQSLMTVLLSLEADRAADLWPAAVFFGMSNASVSRFEINGGSVVVRYLNRVDFLPDELITG